MAEVQDNPEWPADLRAKIDQFLSERLGPDIAAAAIRYAPLGPSWPYDPRHPRTPPHEGGELKASIESHMNGHLLIIAANAPYAAYVELGTSPHPITAHGPWSLWSPVTGQYFGRHVMHPGTRPVAYLRRALYSVLSG